MRFEAVVCRHATNRTSCRAGLPTSRYAAGFGRVLSRTGNRRADVFFEDHDRRRCPSMLADCAERHGLEVRAHFPRTSSKRRRFAAERRRPAVRVRLVRPTAGVPARPHPPAPQKPGAKPKQKPEKAQLWYLSPYLQWPKEEIGDCPYFPYLSPYLGAAAVLALPGLRIVASTHAGAGRADGASRRVRLGRRAVRRRNDHHLARSALESVRITVLEWPATTVACRDGTAIS